METSALPQIVATCSTDRQLFELLHYSDGKWGIRCNGIIYGMWTAAHENDCISAFMDLADVDDALATRTYAHAAVAVAPHAMN